MGESSWLTSRATRYAGTGARRRAATTNTTSAAAIEAYCAIEATFRVTPAWYRSAPGVTLWGVVIGSVTRPMSVKKSAHDCGPATSVAAKASTIRTMPPVTTADHRRVTNAHAST